jgi:predicted Fe-Mo cluster-binding NifX family protein
MRVAIATDGYRVSPHFGRCMSYTIVDIAGGGIALKKEVKNPGHEPGRIPQFLHNLGAEAIVCGGMGARAFGLFTELGIRMITGVDMSVEEALRFLAEGKLESGKSMCSPGVGRGYGMEKTVCDHAHE